jgi:NADPH2:quinone reductase
MASGPIRAARLHRHGEPLVVEDLVLPEPSPGEVRVELEFAGVNPIDMYIAAGAVAGEAPLPRTLGGEAVGTLDGRQVLVAGELLGAARDGLWAEAAIVPEPAVTPLPDGVDAQAAAAMGVAGLTAINVVRDVARLSAEDRAIVLGASGGVGSMIVSLAAAVGATVWGQTGSQNKERAIAEQGADKIVVGGPEALPGAIAELQPTVVFDALGGDFTSAAIKAIGPRGRIVSYGASAGGEIKFDVRGLYRKMVSLLGYGGATLSRDERRRGLQAALEALRGGAIKVRIDGVLPLDQVDEAFARLKERRVQGNLLLDVRQ